MIDFQPNAVQMKKGDPIIQYFISEHALTGSLVTRLAEAHHVKKMF